MRKINLFLTAGFTLLFSAVFAQDAALTKILSAKDDTAKANSLIAYAKTLSGADSKKAKEQLRVAYQLSRKLNYPAGAGNALLQLGTLNRQAGKYAECNQDLYQALAFFRTAKDDRGICNCQLGLGSVCELTGKRDSAIFYYMAAVKVIEERGYLTEKVKVFYNLGMIYNNLKEYDRSISYQKKALLTARQLKDTSLISAVYGGLSLPLRNAERYEEAFAMASEAVALAKAKNNKLMLCQAYDMFSQAATHVKKFDQAIAAGKTSLQYAEELGDLHTFLTGSISLADAYYGKGAYKDVIPVMLKALQKCKEHNNILYGDDIYARLANTYSQLGNYKAALEAAEELDYYKDSIFNVRKNDIVEEYEVKYQTAQKEKSISEKQLQLAQKDLQLQRSRQLTYTTVGGLLIALLSLGFLYASFRNRKKVHQKELYALGQEKEIQLLQALMQGEEKERNRIAKDLHDGVAGMLAAVKMHINSIGLDNGEIMQAEGYQQGIRLLDEAAKEIRKTSHNLMPEVLLQHGLDEALRRFCNNISNSKALDVQYDSWGDISRFRDRFELSVYRIVQELLNNIVKHSRASQAIVQMSLQNGLLSLTIEDNGVGFQQPLSNDGMGLQGLESRVKALNGKLELSSAMGSGVSAYLEFDTAGLEKPVVQEPAVSI